MPHNIDGGVERSHIKRESSVLSRVSCAVEDRGCDEMTLG